MKLLRRLHLYLGCFFAPLLLFFVATGWYQTFHINRNKRPGEAETWISRLTSIHKDQLYPTEAASGYSTTLFQALIVIMSVALIATVALGLVLALRTLRSPWVVWASLALGILVPVLCLWLGQRH
jgi:multidrug efflux pump subunit AcrB